MFEGAAASVCYTARYPVCAPTSIDSFGKRESLYNRPRTALQGGFASSSGNIRFLCNAIFKPRDSANAKSIEVLNDIDSILNFIGMFQRFNEHLKTDRWYD